MRKVYISSFSQSYSELCYKVNTLSESTRLPFIAKSNTIPSSSCMETNNIMVRQVTVIGATGIQGGSVIRALMKDHAFSLTAVTRNSQSEAAKKLASQGVRLVEANLDDVASLEAAFSGTSVIFAATNFFEPFMMYEPRSQDTISSRSL